MTRHSGWCALSTLATLLASTRVALADVAPLPTLVADYLWLGELVGPLLGLVLLVVIALNYRRMRRAGRSRWRATGVSVLLFISANLLCYLLALGQPRPRSYPPVPADFGRVGGASEPPVLPLK